MAAECLPDELWRRILELGTQRGTLTYRDLCCLSISARRMRRLSGEGSLWSILLASDFPNNSTAATTTKTTGANGSWKTVYRIRYEKDREKKMAAHRRAVLRLESVMAQCKIELKRLKEKREEEMGKLKVAVEELSRLEKVR
ncbi:F-box protein SKIP24-like protein [Drosera capensis]